MLGGASLGYIASEKASELKLWGVFVGLLLGVLLTWGGFATLYLIRKHREYIRGLHGGLPPDMPFWRIRYGSIVEDPTSSSPLMLKAEIEAISSIGPLRLEENRFTVLVDRPKVQQEKFTTEEGDIEILNKTGIEVTREPVVFTLRVRPTTLRLQTSLASLLESVRNNERVNVSVYWSAKVIRDHEVVVCNSNAAQRLWCMSFEMGVR